MREFHQLAKVLAVALNIGMALGVYLDALEPTKSPYLTPIAIATAVVSLIALATAKAGK